MKLVKKWVFKQVIIHITWFISCEATDELLKIRPYSDFSSDTILAYDFHEIFLPHSSL